MIFPGSSSPPINPIPINNAHWQILSGSSQSWSSSSWKSYYSFHVIHSYFSSDLPFTFTKIAEIFCGDHTIFIRGKITAFHLEIPLQLFCRFFYFPLSNVSLISCIIITFPSVSFS